MNTSEMDLRTVPIVDNHAHPLAIAQPATISEFRRHFTEAHAPDLARDHVGNAVHYRWAIKQLAVLLACDPTEEAVLRARQSLPSDDYARHLAQEANIAWLLLDEGHPAPDQAYSAEKMSEMIDIPTARLLRIETAVGELVARLDAFDKVLAEFDRMLTGLRERRYVGLKSIAAYRTGLKLDQVEYSAAEMEFERVRRLVAGRGDVRLASKPLIDFFIWRAMEHVATQRIPIQFHTGYGDPDLDLRLANPLHLRQLFEEAAFRDVPIVLLHESYPYTAEAAYLAAVYPNAYMDLAFSLPPIDWFQLCRVVETALGVAPASKIMVSSDGTRIPEHYWLGAERARLACANVLNRMIDAGMLTDAEGYELASAVLHDNAVRVYALDGLEDAS